MDETTVTYACAARGDRDECVRIGDHERAHVYQYLALGPLFLPLYFACGGVSVRNRFEQAADRYAMTGRGWWPWAWFAQTTRGQPAPASSGMGRNNGRSIHPQRQREYAQHRKRQRQLQRRGNRQAQPGAEADL